MRNDIFLHRFIIIILILIANVAVAQRTAGELAVQYEELTALDFNKAVGHSNGVCIIPCGILEKHGPHLPLGTDLINVRETALRAAKKEYCIIFPEYYFGQIFEAKHQPGTIAYSQRLMWDVLQETCKELARNGLKKIVLLNGHGGNNHFFGYFCQSQLSSRKDYIVVLFSPESDAEVVEKLKGLRKSTTGGHAGETETSMMYAHRPDLVHAELAGKQSGEDLDRLAGIPFAYTGIWWYASFPNHYAGDGSYMSKEIGELLINSRVEQLVKLIQALKQDKTIKELQDRFFNESEAPLQTEQ